MLKALLRPSKKDLRGLLHGRDLKSLVFSFSSLIMNIPLNLENQNVFHKFILLDFIFDDFLPSFSFQTDK